MPRDLPLLKQIVVLAALVILSGRAQAQPQLSDSTLASETSDPTSMLWLLYTEFNTQVTPAQPFRASNQFTLELQPSLPLLLTPTIRMMNFPDLVVGSEGSPRGTQINGLESFTWLTAFGPAASVGGFSWGLGPYVSLPVSTDEELSPSQWQFGGGGVVAWRSPAYVVSALVKAGWTTSGPGEEAGSLAIQYNIQHFFGDGYQVGLGRPRIEYNWNRDGTGGWSIPVGLDIGKVFHFGPLPVKILLEYDFTVLNDSRWNPEHTLRITILPVLPSPVSRPLFD